MCILRLATDICTSSVRFLLFLENEDVNEIIFSLKPFNQQDPPVQPGRGRHWVSGKDLPGLLGLHVHLQEVQNDELRTSSGWMFLKTSLAFYEEYITSPWWHSSWWLYSKFSILMETAILESRCDWRDSAQCECHVTVYPAPTLLMKTGRSFHKTHYWNELQGKETIFWLCMASTSRRWFCYHFTLILAFALKKVYWNDGVEDSLAPPTETESQVQFCGCMTDGGDIGRGELPSHIARRSWA